MSYERTPTRNTFKKGGEGHGDIIFELAPKGESTYGLVAIKNTIISNDWGEKDGYRLVFRNRDNPNCFVCYEQAAVLSDKSNLGKALIRMTNGAFDKYEELDRGEAFRFLMECFDKWFKVVVKHFPSRKDPSVIFAKVSDNDIRLVELDGPPPSVFFKSGGGSKVSAPVKTGFEDYNDAPAAPVHNVQPTAGGAAPTSILDDDIPF